MTSSNPYKRWNGRSVSRADAAHYRRLQEIVDGSQPEAVAPDLFPSRGKTHRENKKQYVPGQRMVAIRNQRQPLVGTISHADEVI